MAGLGKRIGTSIARLLRPPRTARGFTGALVGVLALGAVAGLGGEAFQKFSETPTFCSQCHTMKMEVEAHARGVHRNVACGTCHVEPGLVGLVKSKIKGAHQLVELVLDTYPTPITVANQNDLPSPEKTCMACHPLSTLENENGPIKLVMHARYRENEANTKEMLAVMIRPNGLGDGKESRGAHWHLEVKMEYATPPANEQRIDWIKVTYPNGATEQYIASSQVTLSSDALPDIKRILKTDTIHTMSCTTCHNRVGHEFPSPEEAVDQAVTEGKISQSLPYVVREGIAVLSKSYRSNAEADRAIDGLRELYASRYPLVSRTRTGQVNEAVGQLKLLYKLVADPEMKMLSSDYPNDEGHQSGPGCLRCHDGSHLEVERDGRVLTKAVPWECTTCHTFPQSGPKITSISVLAPPPDHLSNLWVFEHAHDPIALQPGATNSTFCANCHSTSLAKVNHEEMLYHHPAQIEKAGLQVCGYCHNEAFCARCHKTNVLDPTEVQ